VDEWIGGVKVENNNLLLENNKEIDNPDSNSNNNSSDESKLEKESFEELKLFVSENVSSLELVEKFDVPFLIREHERKYQYGISDCTIWKKK
jgi:hypothetical protein